MGRQFDRLGLMFLDDFEIFRTSTAEPTPNGITWSYLKDTSSYLALFKQPRKIIFDLGNLVDKTYTGVWHTTLTATFYSYKDSAEPADIIVPISTHRSSVNAPSHFTIPGERAVGTLKIPHNARKAVFSISACGQDAEEFWWSNVLSSDTHVFGDDNTLFGHSPFRELQLVIDGQLAGVAWPFPVIFTGGVVPGLWRPIVGIDAFDLLEDEIDITPFLPTLVDSEEHTFEIRVVGIEDDGHGHGEITNSINSNWIVTGKVFIWLDNKTSITDGSIAVIHSPRPSISIASTTTKTSDGIVTSLDYSVHVSRSIHISSTLRTSAGLKQSTWTQELLYTNSGTLANKGKDQNLRQNTSGIHISQGAGYRKAFAYPLWVASSYNKLSEGGLTIDATMRRGKNIEQFGELASRNEWRGTAPEAELRGSQMTNFQNGTASYVAFPAERISRSFGSTEQHYWLGGIRQASEELLDTYKVLYQRDLVSVNGSITADTEVTKDKQVGVISQSLQQEGGDVLESAFESVRAILGRGPK